MFALSVAPAVLLQPHNYALDLRPSTFLPSLYLRFSRNPISPTFFSARDSRQYCNGLAKDRFVEVGGLNFSERHKRGQISGVSVSEKVHTVLSPDATSALTGNDSRFQESSLEFPKDIAVEEPRRIHVERNNIGLVRLESTFIGKRREFSGSRVYVDTTSRVLPYSYRCSDGQFSVPQTILAQGDVHEHSSWTDKTRGSANLEVSESLHETKVSSEPRQLNSTDMVSGETKSKQTGYRPAVESWSGHSMWAKLGQRVNLAGILFSSRVVLKDRHLAMPHLSVPDISWIDWSALQAQGFEGVLFDKDNTLTVPYGQNVWPPLHGALQECKAVFGGRIALLSNSAGLYQYDPEGTVAKALEAKLGVPVIRHGSKKPAGTATDVALHFGCEPSLLIMVGDRYFTDIVYGNFNGLLTIRCAPLSGAGEPFIVRQVRKLEDKMLESWKLQGVLPTKHHLFHKPSDFVKYPNESVRAN